MPYKNASDKREANRRAFAKALRLGKPWAVAIDEKAKRTEIKKAASTLEKAKQKWPRQSVCLVCSALFNARNSKHLCCTDPCRKQRHLDTGRANDALPHRRNRVRILSSASLARKRETMKRYRAENRQVILTKDREAKRILRESEPEKVRANKRIYKSRRAAAETIMAINRGI